MSLAMQDGGYPSGALRAIGMLVVCMMGLVASVPAGAQETSSVNAPSAWLSLNALPNWSGFWFQRNEQIMSGRVPVGDENPSLSPEYAARLERARANAVRIGDSANCLPNGVPYIMKQPSQYEFVLVPGGVIIFIEAYMQVRYIYTDGRGHPSLDTLVPTYNGHSIGRWEGDTLIVDTVGLKETTPLTSAGNIFQIIIIEHSDVMRVEERIRRTNENQMEIETTVYDAKAFTKPWTHTNKYIRNDARRQEWNEIICEENNYDRHLAEKEEAQGAAGATP